MSSDIIKIGGIIIHNRKILVGKKKDTFIIPGGKIKNGEDDFNCLKRELYEEFKVNLVHSLYFDTFEDESALEPGVMVVMRVYFTEIDGDPKPSNEITDMKYIDSNNSEKIKLGSIIEHFVIPKLKKEDLID